MKKMIGFISLFGSMSTLLCCALPVTLVSLGMGATFASLTSAIPQIIWIAEHKNILFILTGALLSLSYFFIKRSESMPCPIDPIQRELCQRSRQFSRLFFWTSTIFYFLGLGFAFILPKILYGL
jgi:cbb3-type cytochrome oxidase subunit 1